MNHDSLSEKISEIRDKIIKYHDEQLEYGILKVESQLLSRIAHGHYDCSETGAIIVNIVDSEPFYSLKRACLKVARGMKDSGKYGNITVYFYSEFTAQFIIEAK